MRKNILKENYLETFSKFVTDGKRTEKEENF